MLWDQSFLIRSCCPDRFAAPKPFSDTEQNALRTRYAELETSGNPSRTFDEMGFGLRGTDFPGGGLEQREPTVEMVGVNGQRQVLGHRRTVIAARHQRDRRPERTHPRQMRLPIGNSRLKDR